ncbi:MAG: VWA domain-containing protein [Planctomycetaceae bacterium]|nr:VWA domain-containing protein [Planctomycetaceae bacterium]
MPAHLQSEAAGLEPDSTQVETVTAPYGFLTDEQIYNRKTLRQVLQNVGALGISTFIHTLIFIALGILTMTPEILESLEMVVVNAPEEEIVLEEEMVTVELEEDMTPSEEINTDPTAAPAAGVPTAIGAAIFSEAQFDAEVSDSEVEPTEMAASEIKLPASVSDSLLTAIPLGSYGDPREVVDNIQQAMDRITQELVFMLEESDILVVWVFDQSESMRNDQKEIRERINQVYTELGLADDAAGDHLLTAVTSFGSGYIRHTRKPTSNLELIKKAINEVPIDPSGAELVCPAIVRAISDHTSYTSRGQRRMALIVVSDESGNPENNFQFLENAVQAAKVAKCRTYFLGREAVFGYPHAYMRWQHPQTGTVHWLKVDRGPETAFVEQLQTNGFRRRTDAFSSGFGPYEQCRVARESGGIFFMLPTVEKNLVRGEADKRRYKLKAMKPYLPDLNSRQFQFAKRDETPLRTFIWQVILDLNPLNEQTAEIIEMRMRFSTDSVTFLRQARAEQQKAKTYLVYLANAQKALESGYELRESELNARWQANYDLIYAQLIAYQARVYEYGAALEVFIRNPKTAPLMQPPNRTLVGWDISGQSKLSAAEVSQPYIDRAIELYNTVIELHDGTPWSERAAQEINRGFGLQLVPVYRAPPRRVPAGVPPIPIPKL